MPPVTTVFAAVVAVLTVAGAPGVLRRLPIPAGHDGPEPPWVRLPNRGWLLGLGLASAACGLIGAVMAPAHTLPLWLVWAGPAALLVAIDAATTWLPLSLTRICWAAVALAAAGSLALGLPIARLAGMVLAAAVAFGLFWLLWRLAGGQLGFGDVRLVPMVAAVSMAVSLGTVLAAFILGSLIGVAAGIWARVRGASGGFPYGPALWAGPPVALLVGRVLG